MDISIFLSVGSFAVSERVLKPKASVLVILGCVLVYDLSTKTHDVSALRVYRGPALLAFTLMMAAWSLRTWRRNGVACDELLFLPGTSHDLDAANHPVSTAASNNLSSCNSNEGDAAAGPSRNNDMMPTTLRLDSMPSLDLELTSVAEERTSRLRLTSVDDDEGEGETDERDGIFQRSQIFSDDENMDRAVSETVEEPQSRIERFQENHPNIVRIGSLLFFRTSSTTTQNATYAPSGPSVFGAALDLSMPILFNFHLFILAYNRINSDSNAEFTAKILPLAFLSVLLVRTQIPPGRRRRFWSTMRYIALAPFHRVRFRDAFLGDVLTSLVRPIQDMLFALSYYLTVVYGTVVGSYGLAQAGEILEQSWVLHNVVLPSCAIIPLWWRFLQTLREAYDKKKRWPFYGNSVKYLSAGAIILYGMTHPEGRRSWLWLISFFIAIVYQIWWDTMMDWELFVIIPRPETDQSSDSCDNCGCARISSLSPSSEVLLTIHMYLIQPLSERARRFIASIPRLEQIQLRHRRLYKADTFYYRCFFVNIFLRFLWMLCFIPAYRLTSVSGETEKVNTFSSDVNSYIGVIMPVAEILRRTQWGFLKVEMETIRMMEDTEHRYREVEAADEEDKAIDDQSKHNYRSNSLPFWLDAPQQHQATSGKSRGFKFTFQCDDALRGKMFVAELSLWIVAFVGIGYWATY
jgi:EXS family